MSLTHISNIFKWVARIWAFIVIAICLISLSRVILYELEFNPDFESYLLYTALPLSLIIAFKWQIIGGISATTIVLYTGFIHPFIIAPGLLFIIAFLIKRLAESKNNQSTTSKI